MIRGDLCVHGGASGIQEVPYPGGALLKNPSLAGRLILVGIALGTPGLAFVLLAVLGAQVVGAGVALTVLAVLGGVLAGFGFLFFTAGVAVYVFAPLRTPEGARRGYASYGTILGSLFLAVVAANVVTGLYLVGQTLLGPAGAAGGLAARVTGPTGLIVASLTQEVAILLILYLRIIRPEVITWRDMGLDGNDLGRRVALGLATVVAVLFVAAALSYLLRLVGVEQTQERLFTPLRQGTLAQFVAMLLIASPFTAWVEESFFRGYVFGSLYQVKGPWPAYLASALIFAAAHVNLQALLPLFVIGLIFAFVYHRSGSIVPGMVAHAVNNAVGLAMIYFGVA